jgi:hypothetical protein
MTPEQQAAYLTAKGWKREGEYWRDGRTAAILWEQSAAVKRQQFRDGHGGEK